MLFSLTVQKYSSYVQRSGGVVSGYAHFQRRTPAIQSNIMQLTFFIILFAFFNECSCAPSKKQVAKKSDPNDNRGNTPFFLQDPYDQMCLGPKGFTVCDENALWILTKRTGKKTYSLVSLLNPSSSGMCLERKSSLFGLLSSDRVSVGSCNSGRAKSWEFEFVDQTHVKLSTKGQCLVRGKKQFKNSISVQACSKGEFIPLIYHPTAVHENGFYIKAADGTCFDGNKFRSCEGAGAKKLLWGVGVRYVWGEAKRYLFSFNVEDRSHCLVAHGSTVQKGLCKEAGATTWALAGGQLTYGDKGANCLARKTDDTAVLAKCSSAYEYVTLEVPSVYTNEQLLEMLRNPVCTRAYLAVRCLYYKLLSFVCIFMSTM